MALGDMPIEVRETGRVMSAMTRLRLTPQARFQPDAAKLRPAADTRPPWAPTFDEGEDHAEA